MTFSVLDRDHLAQYTGGDAALEAELFGLLTSQIDNCTAKMRDADQPQAWKDAAHTLKGAARGVGAMALGEACAQAETRPHDEAALDAVLAEAEKTREAMAAA
ncbi:Hpt domain-containing protein [Maricaulaceae bacterium NA33B04]|nr:Hpt domain-containing protein [Maricaulaceae bacterium NA33B04]